MSIKDLSSLVTVNVVFVFSLLTSSPKEFDESITSAATAAASLGVNFSSRGIGAAVTGTMVTTETISSLEEAAVSTTGSLSNALFTFRT